MQNLKVVLMITVIILFNYSAQAGLFTETIVDMSGRCHSQDGQLLMQYESARILSKQTLFSYGQYLYSRNSLKISSTNFFSNSYKVSSEDDKAAFQFWGNAKGQVVLSGKYLDNTGQVKTAEAICDKSEEKLGESLIKEQLALEIPAFLFNDSTVSGEWTTVTFYQGRALKSNSAIELVKSDADYAKTYFTCNLNLIPSNFTKEGMAPLAPEIFILNPHGTDQQAKFLQMKGSTKNEWIRMTCTLVRFQKTNGHSSYETQHLPMVDIPEADLRKAVLETLPLDYIK